MLMCRQEAPDMPAPDSARTGIVAFNDEMLTGAIQGRSTRHIAIDLGAGAPAYVPGDHVAVHPENPPALVEGICARLGLA